MASEFRSERTVEFVDTDMAGIVHFSNFFRYMEATEHAFFRSLGLSLHSGMGEGMRGWARVDARCEYKSPLRYGERFEVHLSVVDKTDKSLTYAFAFRRGDSVVARARLSVVCVARAPGEERMRAVPMPAEVDGKIEVAPHPPETDSHQRS